MKSIDLNNINDLTLFKNELNKTIDNLITSKSLNEKIENIKDLGFTDLINLYESVSDKIIDTKEGKKITKKYVNLLKESKTLNSAFALSKFIFSGVKSENSEMLLNEAINLHKENINKEYVNDLKKLGNIVSDAVRESKINESDISDIINNKHSVCNSLDYILFNKKNMKNLNEYVNNLSNVTKFINENVSNEPSDSIDSINSLSEMVNSINKETSFISEQWQKDLIDSITCNNVAGLTNDVLFEDYKKDCLNLLDNIINAENIDIETKSKMGTLKEGLSLKMYGNNDFYKDIVNLAELKNTLAETWEEKSL